MFSNVVVKSVSSCGVSCVTCTAHNTHHSLKYFLLTISTKLQL